MPTHLPSNHQLARASLSHGLAALAASLCVVDGALKREEFRAFRTLFPIPMRRDMVVRRFFMEACHRPLPPSAARERLWEIYADRPDMCEEILARFVALATADGSIHPTERAWLIGFSKALHVPLRTLVLLVQQRSKPGAHSADPYALLGIPPESDLRAIKRAWQTQLRACHPDALAAQGLPLEEQHHFGRRMTELNAAYDQILAERGQRR